MSASPESRDSPETLPTDRLPTERLPTERSPTEESPTEEIPAEQFPTGALPTVETPTEQRPTEKPSSGHRTRKDCSANDTTGPATGAGSPNLGTGLVSVYLVDDHRTARKALAATIEATRGMNVCGRASRPEKAIRDLEELCPDVAVVDISLARGDGLDLIETIRTEVPEVKVIIYSMYEEEVCARWTLWAGASGYVRKREPAALVVDAIQAAEAGL